jgi:hypothetical protein
MMPVVAAGLLPTWVSSWLTPIWILSMGVAGGIAVLAALWGLLFLVHRPAARGALAAVFEGVSLPITVVLLVLVALAGVLLPVLNDSRGVLESLGRLSAVGTDVRTYALPAPEDVAAAGETAQVSRTPGARRAGVLPDGRVVTAVPLGFRREELRTLRLTSSRVDVNFSTHPIAEAALDDVYLVPAGAASHQGYTYDVTGKQRSIFPEAGASEIFVASPPDRPTQFTMTVTTDVAHPQARAVPMTAAVVVLLYLVYVAQVLLLPKESAVALATAKSETGRGLFWIVIVLIGFGLYLSIYLPYNTFGEDIEVLKESGLTAIKFWAVILAVLAATHSLFDEIEGRTALTVLSKPIGRQQFIVGKFFGITWMAALMYVLLGLVLLVIVAFKPIYDAREGAALEPTWQTCHLEMFRTVPGLALGYMEVMMMAAVSVAISTRLPLLANVTLCAAIYALGHLTPLIVESSWGQFEPVAFAGKLIAVVIPVLDHFNIESAVAAGIDVPIHYLGAALVYCLLYCTVAMLLALTLFEDRDLA